MARKPPSCPWILPLLSGVLLPLGFPPVSIPFLPFVGVVPLLVWLARARPLRELVIGSSLFALAYFGGNLWGMLSLVRFTWAGLPGFAGILLLHGATFLFFPVALNFANRARPVPLALAAPVFWLVSEHARSYGDLAFPWVTLGYSLSSWPWLLQHADLVGVYGISAWLLLVNALVAQAALAPGGRARLRPAASALLLVLVPILYGVVRSRQVAREAEQAPKLRIAVLQPNVAQELKWTPEAASAIAARFARLVERAEELAPDLVVGPEASLPFVLPEESPRLPSVIPAGRSPLVLGIVTGIGPPSRGARGRLFDRHRNSAVLAAPDRTVLGRHDKQLLVPITEKIPYDELFGVFLPLMRRQFGRFVPGDVLSVLRVDTASGSAPVGVLICYESLFPSLARTLRSLGAELLVIVTNDAWFGRTSFPHQHAAFAALRAIENRIAIVRSANTGISLVFDPVGRVHERTRLFEEALFVASVPLMKGRTVYDRLGEFVLGIGYVGSAALLVRSWRAARRPSRPRR